MSVLTLRRSFDLPRIKTEHPRGWETENPSRSPYADANMSFVHGFTAHLACCEACAKKWKNVVYDSDTDDDDVPKTNEKCPVCRQRIDVIVKQF